MPELLLNCPNCGNPILVDYSRPFPFSLVGSVTVTCPFCEVDFPFGYTNQIKYNVDTRYNHEASAKRSIERGDMGTHKANDDSDDPGATQSAASGQTLPDGRGSAGGRHVSQPSKNDNRSNAMNPNNMASKATASNRSNQMNPNNSAFRSSRGGKR